MISHREQRMKELRRGVAQRHSSAGKVVQTFVRYRTPIGTPESTGDPNYPITAALWRSINFSASHGHVDIGTNRRYGPYVHNGTYDYNRGPGLWTEAEAREFDSLTDTGDGPGVGRKGMRPRAFLVNGLLESRSALYPIYHKPIN
jgi:hypothetical protein